MLKISCMKVVWLSITACVVFAISHSAVPLVTPVSHFGVSQAWAASGDGKITLDSSRATREGGGTVWTNNALIVSSSASKTENVNLKVIPSNLTTIVNTPGSDGVLEETSSEFAASSQEYTDLNDGNYTGSTSPLEYFHDASGQLFDFARYKAAADATNNTMTWTTFRQKVTAEEQLYGIVHVTLDANGDTENLDVGSVNVKGALVIDLINGSSTFKVKVLVPININPVTSPTTGTVTLSPSDFNTWTSAAAARTSTADTFPWPSGYASAWNDVAASQPDKNPRGVALSGGHQPFGPYEDMPALMYSGGIVDIHHAANISGVVYTPNFIEIEQKTIADDQVQYINGVVIAGNGIYLESRAGGGGIAVVYDPDTMDSLLVQAGSGSLAKSSWKRD